MATFFLSCLFTGERVSVSAASLNVTSASVYLSASRLFTRRTQKEEMVISVRVNSFIGQ